MVAERKAPPPPRQAGPSKPAEPISRPPPRTAEPSQPRAAAPPPVKAAAAVLPEKRMSTMNEAQIMEKLRSVISAENPSLLYSKIKKVGQGYVHSLVPPIPILLESKIR